MNKSALKIFATNARIELLKKVEAKAMKIGVTEDNIKKADVESSDAIFIDGRHLSREEKTQRDKLIARINQIGFKQVMEEVAYTWFNRFTALRYMEVNEYLPTDVRVLSSTNSDSADPDMINEALTLDLEIDKEYVYELKLNNKTEELFKYLIIKHCNDLNRFLPFMFKTIDDYTEILFPEGLLAKDSFIREMTNTNVIPEYNWRKVEVIGWLYQYYIAEEKDRVIKAKKKYKTEEIPFATQLFTPDWIVRYMVQNSLGRYWIESYPEHRDLLSNWEFYLEKPNPNPDFEEILAPYINRELKVEDIKCFDPAMGSGHILVYMFDVLYEIYSKCGYMEREIPRLIIENNLYGLDIDDRAYQLACFSVVMKALEYNVRFFRSVERDGLSLNLASIQETNLLNEEAIIYIAGEHTGKSFDKTKMFIEQFLNAKTIGSLLTINTVDKAFFMSKLESIKSNPAKDLFEEETRKNVLTLLPLLIKQAEIMNGEYDILVTNPPYMGNRYMNQALSDFMKEVYPNNKSDAFSAFMEYCLLKVKPNGQLGFLTPFVWMFISTYENIRDIIVNQKNISSLIELEYNSFSEAMVPVCTFTLRNYGVNITGEYIKLSDFTGSENQPIKTVEAVKNPNVDYRYSVVSREFKLINGSPIAYWTSAKERDAFANSNTIKDIAEPKVGLFTCDNERFLRLWQEVDVRDLAINKNNPDEVLDSGQKWVPYNKGGKFRKWYGNNEYVVNFSNKGKEISEFRVQKGQSYSLPGYKQYFKSGITWSFISSSNFGARYFPNGFIFDVAGSSVFPKESDIYYLTGYLCSKVTWSFLKAQNPTLNFQVGNVANLPIVSNIDINLKKRIEKLSKENIDIAKQEWDSYESSWEFKKHPIITFKDESNLISEAFQNWSNHSEEQFSRVKKNEEEINMLFIEIFNLQQDMNEIVSDKDITLRKADREMDIKSLINYSVGCMLGRYSLNEEGLIFAGGELEVERYKNLKVDKDNILPILPGAYFEDDIVSKFVNFIKIVFSEEKLSQNLDYIAESLGKKKNETSKETIRNYFLNEFMKNHLDIYSARGRKSPIYWLFTSGKQKAFNCLIYMHRYDKTTLSRIRTDYLHEYQIRLDAERKSLVSIIEGNSTAKEISNAKKELKTLGKKIEELKEYDELLHHMADMQIEIDLDEGVVVNYEKFKGLVAKI